MSDIHVLVVFYSRHGTAEKLALAAGVGAIQARANIRLRRVADLADRATIEASAEWQENLDRMNRDYVTPRPADPEWAHVIVLSTPLGRSTELERYLDSLSAGAGSAGRIAAPLAPGNDLATLKPIYAAAACAGLIVAPPAAGSGDELDRARDYGRRVAQMARALRADAGGS
jgi:NAD(P)H dehydrogenase (quinone)